MSRVRIEPQDLVIHILNVGFGDTILIGFPAQNLSARAYGLVDCNDARKTLGYLNNLIPKPTERKHLAFVCATHPHMDHISGIQEVLKDPTYKPSEFWDSGFRHNSLTYRDSLLAVSSEGIKMIQVSSGMEWYFGSVRITVLSPSVALRNRYATYGVDMNNASVVLRLEHHSDDILLTTSREYSGKASEAVERNAGQSVVILAGDAEFDSWAQIAQDFPRLERTSGHDPLVKKMINYLACSAVKVAHHGSMHSAPLDIYEKMKPQTAIISTKQEVSTKRGTEQDLRRGLFPHSATTIALEECDARVLTTDGSHEGEEIGGKMRAQELSHEGSVILVVPPAGKLRWCKLNDKADEIPEPPTEV